MPDNVAQSTSNNISGSGYRTRQRWRGSDSAEKCSRIEDDGSRWHMEGSESSKPPMNHIFQPTPIPLTWSDCLGFASDTPCGTNRRFSMIREISLIPAFIIIDR